MTSNQAEENIYTESDDITVKGRDCPKPFLQFSDFEWPQEIRRVIEKERFTNPTPIQAQGFPVALEGRDLVGIAQTGSGKTLSYIMPAVVNLENAIKNQGKTSKFFELNRLELFIASV